MAKILIFRPDNVGDVVLFSGALRHIRNLYPEAHITLAVQDHIKNLVELCPHVDKVISVEDMSWWLCLVKSGYPLIYKTKRIIDWANKIYNSLVYDHVIYPVKSPQINHLKMLKDFVGGKIIGIVGCPVNEPITGYPAGLNPKIILSEFHDVSNEFPWRHELDTNLDFLKYLGCDVQNISEIQPEFWLSDSDEDCLRIDSRKGQRIIGIFPGASLEYRCWNPGHYSELFKLITEPHFYIILGGPGDAEIAFKVESEIRKVGHGNEVLNLVGKTSLRELVKYISCCDLFVGMESSALQIAISKAVRSIGICGGGHYGRFIPWGDPLKHIFLSHKMDCFQCSWQCSKEEMECIKNVTPYDVAIAVKKMLNY